MIGERLEADALRRALDRDPAHIHVARPATSMSSIAGALTELSLSRRRSRRSCPGRSPRRSVNRHGSSVVVGNGSARSARAALFSRCVPPVQDQRVPVRVLEEGHVADAGVALADELDPFASSSARAAGRRRRAARSRARRSRNRRPFSGSQSASVTFPASNSVLSRAAAARDVAVERGRRSTSRVGTSTKSTRSIVTRCRRRRFRPGPRRTPSAHPRRRPRRRTRLRLELRPTRGIAHRSANPSGSARTRSIGRRSAAARCRVERREVGVGSSAAAQRLAVETRRARRYE